MKRIALLLLGALIILSAIVVVRPGSSGLAQDRSEISTGTSPNHPVGTDQIGRDRLTRIAEALLLCLSLSAMAAILATGIAAAIALSAAHTEGFIAKAILFLSDAALALPGIFLLMIVRASLPLGLSASSTAVITFLLLAALGWPVMVRTIYAEIIKHRESDWAFFCVASGLTRSRIFLAHMLSHISPLLRTHFLICVPAFLVAEANLGALGLGIADPLPSWGGMLNELASSSLVRGSNWRYLSAILLPVLLMLFELITMRSKNALKRSSKGAAC